MPRAGNASDIFVEGVARISSAVFVHANGLGSAFQVAIHSRTSFSSATTLLWMPRLSS